MRLLIFSNIFVSMAAAALTVQSYYLLGRREFLWREPHAWAPALLIFCATLFVYNLDRLVSSSREDAVETTERHRWVGGHKDALWALLIWSVLGGALTLIFLPPRVIWALVPLGAVAIAYSVPLLGAKLSGEGDGREREAVPLPQSRVRRLKEVPGLKIFLIALVWAAVTVVLPAIHASVALLSRAVLLTFFARLIFIFAITLPFDVRDMSRDKQSGIWTLPMALGAGQTRTLAVLLMLPFALVVTLHYGFSLDSATPPLLLSAFLTGVALLFSARVRPELYYVGLLDGMMLLQSLMSLGYREGWG